jgi:hypothetical protein
LIGRRSILSAIIFWVTTCPYVPDVTLHVISRSDRVFALYLAISEVVIENLLNINSAVRNEKKIVQVLG